MPVTVRLRRDEADENLHLVKTVHGKKWNNHFVLQKVVTGKGLGEGIPVVWNEKHFLVT